MHSLRLLLFVVTIWAAVSLAAPTLERRRPVVNYRYKRSFKVPRHANPKASRNPTKAILKSLRKYGLNCDGIGGNQNGANGAGTGTGAAAGTGTGTGTGAASTGTGQAQNENGEVRAKPEDQTEALFLSPVKIGGQTLHLDFDTGSSDLWVFNTRLSQAEITSHTAFNPNKSSTFKLLQGEKFDITYGDGSGASGVVGTDTVDIGGATVQNQAIELATAVSQSFRDDVKNDGLLGLAFSTLNTVQPTQQKTFFDNILADLDEPVFTANLQDSADGVGAYEFGTIDTTQFVGDLTWTKVQAESGFWQFDSTSFLVGNTVTQRTSSSPAIADTGTSLLLVDDAVAKAFYSQVKGAVNDANIGGFVYPCNAKLPDFGVAIGNTGYFANVTGQDLTFAPIDNTNTNCFGGVQSNGGAGIQIFGDTMFKTQFVAFNGGNNSLGIAPKIPANGGNAGTGASAAGKGSLLVNMENSAVGGGSAQFLQSVYMAFAVIGVLMM